MTKANANVKVNSVITFSAIATMVNRVVLMLEYLSIGIIYNFFLEFYLYFRVCFLCHGRLWAREKHTLFGAVCFFFYIDYLFVF